MNIEAMKLALDALESRCGTNADERLPGGAITALRAALSQQPAAGEPVTESFVQQVPDHCDRVLWRGRYLHLPMTRPENVAAKQDAAALNWIERQHLEELGMGLVIDAPNDGMYYVCGDSGTTHYGKTLREALASAIQQAEAKQVENSTATPEPVEDGIRNAVDELNCAEEVLDAITCEFSDGEFPMTDFNCIGDYITAVVDVFKERLAAQRPATATACGIPGMAKTTCPYCELSFTFEHEQPTTPEPTVPQEHEAYSRYLDAATPDRSAQVFYAADGDDETGAGYHMKPYVHWFDKTLAADTKRYTRPAPSLPDSLDPPTEDGTEYDYASGYTAGYAAGWNEYRAGMAWLLDPKP